MVNKTNPALVVLLDTLQRRGYVYIKEQSNLTSAVPMLYLENAVDTARKEVIKISSTILVKNQIVFTIVVQTRDFSQYKGWLTAAGQDGTIVIDKTKVAQYDQRDYVTFPSAKENRVYSFYQSMEIDAKKKHIYTYQLTFKRMYNLPPPPKN